MAAPSVSASMSVVIAAAAVSIIISIVALTIALDERATPSTESNVETEMLDRNAIYQGSATLAGLAIFGSLFSTRIKWKFASKSRPKKLGIIMFVTCPYVLALFHIWFMFASNQNEGVIFMLLMSMAMIIGTVTGYTLVKFS